MAINISPYAFISVAIVGGAAQVTAGAGILHIARRNFNIHRRVGRKLILPNESGVTVYVLDIE